MQVQTTGIVIRVKPYGERDKLITVLTADRGVITVSAKGALKLTASFSRCTQLYAYSNLTLYEKNGFYTLLEGGLIASFFSLSENLDCFALAAYLCEASAAVVVPNDGEGEILNLLLNALYALKSNLFAVEFIKAVFELRLAALSGLEPTIGDCPGCGRPLSEAGERYFFLTEGLILCSDCAAAQPAETPPYRLSGRGLRRDRLHLHRQAEGDFFFPHQRRRAARFERYRRKIPAKSTGTHLPHPGIL